jgi:hypothetical protein
MQVASRRSSSLYALGGSRRPSSCAPNTYQTEQNCQVQRFEPGFPLKLSSTRTAVTNAKNNHQIIRIPRRTRTYEFHVWSTR